MTYGYNPANELTTLTDPANARTTFAYDKNGNRTTTSYPDGVSMTAGYDDAQRLDALTAAKAGGPTLLSYSYSFNNPSYVNPSGNHDTGLVFSITDAEANTSIAQGYDAANRLTSWVVTPGSGSTFPALNYQYAYDGNGNRTSINANGSASTLGYNAANEWTTDTAGGKTATYTWDGAGNELGNDGFGDPTKALKITYNDRNQTTSVTDTQGNVIPMAYSGPSQAERVSAGWAASNPATPNGPATYTYGAAGLASATDNAGAAYYTRDPSGTLVSQRLPNGTTYYYLFDGQGDVVRLVDSTGAVAATYYYCPTGNDAEPPTGPAAAGNPYRDHSNFNEPATKTNVLPNGAREDSNSGNFTKLNFAALIDPNIGGGPGRYVYRAVSYADWDTILLDQGIIARAPNANDSLMSHVLGKRQSQWISTTKSPYVALYDFGGIENGVVRIDLWQVQTQVVDLSGGIPGVPSNYMASRWARKFREVLVQGYIPQSAIQWWYIP